MIKEGFLPPWSTSLVLSRQEKKIYKMKKEMKILNEHNLWDYITDS